MGARKKEPTAILNRNDKKYIFFDNQQLTILEKEINFLTSVGIIETTNLQKAILEQKKEFMNLQNYNNFIDDVKRLLEISLSKSKTKEIR